MAVDSGASQPLGSGREPARLAHPETGVGHSSSGGGRSRCAPRRGHRTRSARRSRDDAARASGRRLRPPCARTGASETWPPISVLETLSNVGASPVSSSHSCTLAAAAIRERAPAMEALMPLWAARARAVWEAVVVSRAAARRRVVAAPASAEPAAVAPAAAPAAPVAAVAAPVAAVAAPVAAAAAPAAQVVSRACLSTAAPVLGERREVRTAAAAAPRRWGSPARANRARRPRAARRRSL